MSNKFLNRENSDFILNAIINNTLNKLSYKILNMKLWLL